MTDAPPPPHPRAPTHRAKPGGISYECAVWEQAVAAESLQSAISGRCEGGSEGGGGRGGRILVQ